MIAVYKYTADGVRSCRRPLWCMRTRSTCDVCTWPDVAWLSGTVNSAQRSDWQLTLVHSSLSPVYAHWHWYVSVEWPTDSGIYSYLVSLLPMSLSVVHSEI